jgi:hypothetical protein
MSETCSQPTAPLDDDGLLTLSVLMAVEAGPLSFPAIADRVQNLAAPGFDTDRNRIGAAIERLHADGYLDAEGLDGAGNVTWQIAGPGRDLATDLGGRAPGQACDATRTCLLLRLCLDGTMPEQNREVLVASLLDRSPPFRSPPCRSPQSGSG